MLCFYIFGLSPSTSSPLSLLRRDMRLLVLALCVGYFALPCLAVMGGVLQFSQGNATVQGPIYQTGLTSSGTVLWATAPGGIVYQINATSMQYISSTTLSSPSPSCSGTVYLGLPTCLFTDDAHGRVYVCYAPTSGTCMSLYILNTTLGIVSSVSYAPVTSGAVYDLPLTAHYYDPSSRMLASVSWLSGSGEQGIQLYNVSSDTLHTGGISVDALYIAPLGIDGVVYSSVGDTLYILYHFIYTPPHFYNEIGFIPGVTSGVSCRKSTWSPFTPIPLCRPAGSGSPAAQ
jgi:hypothetical protein